jgi:FeS assembly SUF system regulator
MLRLSKLTDYGIVLLAQMAKADSGVLFSARALSESSGISTPTVEKILKQMVRVDLLTSKRGATGGYALVLDPAEISLGSIIDLLQGAIALTECTDASQTICEVVECCDLRNHWPLINKAVRAALGAISLKDLAGNAEDLPSLRIGCSDAPLTTKVQENR